MRGTGGQPHRLPLPAQPWRGRHRDGGGPPIASNSAAVSLRPVRTTISGPLPARTSQTYPARPSPAIRSAGWSPARLLTRPAQSTPAPSNKTNVLFEISFLGLRKFPGRSALTTRPALIEAAPHRTPDGVAGDTPSSCQRAQSRWSRVARAGSVPDSIMSLHAVGCLHARRAQAHRGRSSGTRQRSA